MEQRHFQSRVGILLVHESNDSEVFMDSEFDNSVELTDVDG